MKKYNIEINNITFQKNFLIVDWIANIGWGQLTIEIVNGQFDIDSEHLGMEFVKECLEATTQYILEHGKLV